MLKILIILVLIGYVFYKATSFLFNGLFRGFVKNDGYSNQQSHSRTRKARGGNVNIDSVPKNKSEKDMGYEGGEYVDYEEVK